MATPPSRAASSSSPCWSSPAPAPAAPRPPYARLVTQAAATVCSSPTPPAAPPSGAARPPPPYATTARTARVPPGTTPCSRTTPSTAWVACTWARRPSASRLASSPGHHGRWSVQARDLQGCRPGRLDTKAYNAARASRAAGQPTMPGCERPPLRGLPAWLPGPGRQGLSDQEVLLDLRRRQLGLRHRLRRPGPRPGLRPQRQRLRLRHRGLLQHRRSGLQGLEPGPGGSSSPLPARPSPRRAWPRSP